MTNGGIAMKCFVGALALTAGMGVRLLAQTSAPPPDRPSGLGLSTYVGMFAPVLSLVPIKNGADPDVRLQPAASVAAELTKPIGRALAVYGGVTHARSRVNHSSAMVLSGTDEQRMSDSPVNVTVPSVGLVYSPRVSWLVMRPTIRLGAGVKFYDFQLREVATGVQDPMADVGIGFMSTATGDLSFMAEGRWMPSKFDPTFLPVPALSAQSQLQNDWVLHIGIRFKARN
jgi:hypothetical protein